MRKETAEILAFLDAQIPPSPEEVGLHIADDFRKRRIEKNLTREDMAKKSRVPLSNIARFEQKGLISLNNLIALAMALGYLAEIKNIFAEPKFSTMQELYQIRKNMGRKKSYPLNRESSKNKSNEKD